MERLNWNRIRVLLYIAATLSTSTASSQPVLINLGTLPGAVWAESTSVNDDGSVVVGHSGTGPEGGAFKWTDQGMVQLGFLANASSAKAFGVSGDGLLTVGRSIISGIEHPTLWTDTSPEDLGWLPGGGYATAEGISSNGAAIVGTSNSSAGDRAVIWSIFGLQDLGVLAGGTFSAAHAVNCDGRVVVGGSGANGVGRAFRWSDATGMVDIGGTSADAVAVSSDGTVVISNFAFRAWMWTADKGIVDLGVPPGSGASYATDVSGDGSIVVGYGAAGDRAFMWTQELGMVDLNVYLRSLGLDLTGWELRRATSISSDGTAIAVDGYYNGQTRCALVRFTGPNRRLSPVSQTVGLGRLTSGDLASLANDDNNAQIICKFFVPNQSSPFINTQLTFTSSTRSPKSLSFEVKAKWNSGGQYSIKLTQFNYLSGADEQVLGETALAGSFSLYKGVALGILENYVRQSDGELKARIVIRQVGPSTSLLPCIAFEFANQVVTG